MKRLKFSLVNKTISPFFDTSTSHNPDVLMELSDMAYNCYKCNSIHYLLDEQMYDYEYLLSDRNNLTNKSLIVLF